MGLVLSTMVYIFWLGINIARPKTVNVNYVVLKTILCLLYRIGKNIFDLFFSQVILSNTYV